MPTTMFNWLIETSRPRRCGGAISVMYMGQTTDADPTATPPTNRKKRNAYQFHAAAQPTAETRNNTASRISTGRRPHQSAGRPEARAPAIVPIKALETVNPSRLSLSVNAWRNASVAPEITAVSNPNNSEPSAATPAVRNKKRRLVDEPDRGAPATGGRDVCMGRLELLPAKRKAGQPILSIHLNRADSLTARGITAACARTPGGWRVRRLSPRPGRAGGSCTDPPPQAR